jgi:hypothetical protein
MEAEARNGMKLHGAAALLEQMEADAKKNFDAAERIKSANGAGDPDYSVRLNVGTTLQGYVDKFAQLLYSSDNEEIRELKDEAIEATQS